LHGGEPLVVTVRTDLERAGVAVAPGLHAKRLGFRAAKTVGKPALREIGLRVGERERLEHFGRPVDIVVARDDHHPGLDRGAIAEHERLDLGLEESLELGVLGRRRPLGQVTGNHDEIEPHPRDGGTRAPPQLVELATVVRDVQIGEVENFHVTSIGGGDTAGQAQEPGR
jgi:hypothetical protein